MKAPLELRRATVRGAARTAPPARTHPLPQAVAAPGFRFADVARSGRDFSRPPGRREWSAADGIRVSVADPPSQSYGRGDNVELDREFVTTLAGPSGSLSVSWSTSIRIVKGELDTNELTAGS